MRTFRDEALSCVLTRLMRKQIFSGILRRELPDARPILFVTALREQAYESIVQQACQRHRDAQAFGRGEREPDVFESQWRGERRGLKVRVGDQAAVHLVNRRGE